MKQLLLRALAVVPVLLLVSSFAFGDQAMYLFINGNPQPLTLGVCPTGGTACTYIFSGGTITTSTDAATHGGIPQITLTTNTTQTSGTNNYEIDYVANNFLGNASAFTHSISGTLAVGDQSTSNIFYDTGNTIGPPPAQGTQVGTSLTIHGAGAGHSVAMNESGAFKFTSPYALTDQILLTLTLANDTGQVTSSFNTIPEPASLFLMGSAFLALGGTFRRRLLKK